MEKVNKNIINVVVKGEFVDINDRIINYRVKVSLPNCLEEWLLSNICNRYLLPVIKSGKEYREDGSIVDNENYKFAKSLRKYEIEKTDKKGENLMEDTGKLPTFYGKSIFDCSYQELQDLATAIGLHEVKIEGPLEEIKKNILLSYLKRIKKIPQEKIKEMSFYKYDNKRMKYYIEFSEEDKKRAVINEYQCADFEEFENEQEKIQGFRNLGDFFNTPVENQRTEEVDSKENYKNRRNKEGEAKKELPLSEDNRVTAI